MKQNALVRNPFKSSNSIFSNSNENIEKHPPIDFTLAYDCLRVTEETPSR